MVGMSPQTSGTLFLVVLVTCSAVWFAITKRRQSWWVEFERRPRDITGERWLKGSEARADKPMPDRYPVTQRSRSRRR